jgi:hypothetical protein
VAGIYVGRGILCGYDLRLVQQHSNSKKMAPIGAKKIDEVVFA